MKSYILTEVKGYGWICRITINDKIIYIGEYQSNYMTAMDKAFAWEIVNAAA